MPWSVEWTVSADKAVTSLAITDEVSTDTHGTVSAVNSDICSGVIWTGPSNWCVGWTSTSDGSIVNVVGWTLTSHRCVVQGIGWAAPSEWVGGAPPPDWCVVYISFNGE